MIVYKATAPDGKAYIGITRKTLAERKADHYKKKKKHSPLLAKALKEAGKRMTWEVLDVCTNERQLCLMEQFYIKKFNTKYPAGFNVYNGGGGLNKINVANQTSFTPATQIGIATRFKKGNVPWQTGKTKQPDGTWRPATAQEQVDNFLRRARHQPRDRTAWSKAYNAKNKDILKAKAKVYKAKNRDKINAYKRVWAKQWQLKNKDRYRANYRAYYAKHKDKILATARNKRKDKT